MRIDAGGVEEDVDVPGIGVVPVRYTRCPAGWNATFTVRLREVSDLGVEHRLVAPSLHDARDAVPRAVAFLAGLPMDEPVPAH